MAFDKLKGLVSDVKTTANKHLNQENLNRLVDGVKSAATDVKNSVTEYVNQDPTERAIAKLNREKEANLKRASLMLSIDFRKENGNAKFYIDNNYDAPYNQQQWQELYEELSAKEDPQALAPMYNAVVVSEYGYFIRRGLEPLEAKIVRFIPGKNDEVSCTFIYEPYTYKKNPSAAIKPSVPRYNPQTTGADTGGANAPLSYHEKKEIEDAKRKYTNAMSDAALNKGRPTQAVYDGAEARAKAEYMKVLAKYAGRK